MESSLLDAEERAALESSSGVHSMSTAAGRYRKPTGYHTPDDYHRKNTSLEEYNRRLDEYPRKAAHLDDYHRRTATMEDYHRKPGSHVTDYNRRNVSTTNLHPGEYGYRKSTSNLLSAEDYNARRLSDERRASAVAAARKLSAMNATHGQVGADGRPDRRISVLPGGAPMSPNTLHRSISAFGEITVMPVGDNEDDDLRISVEEELIK